MELNHVVVTGGAGFIGSHAAEFYAAKAKKVTVLDNLSRGSLLGKPVNQQYAIGLLKKLKNVQVINADVRTDDLRDHMTDADIVVHTAGQTAVTTSLVNPRLDFEINALGTLNVLEAVRLANTDPAVIYCSTNKVYGENVHMIGIKETDTRYEFDPEYQHGVHIDFPIDRSKHTPYGCSKLAGDLYCQDYGHLYNMRTGVFRMSCLPAGSKVLTVDGWIPIEILVSNKQHTRVVSLAANGSLTTSPISAWHQRRDRTFRLTARSGFTLRATGDHPLLTPNGYRSVSDLRSGDTVRLWWSSGMDASYSFSSPMTKEELVDRIRPHYHGTRPQAAAYLRKAAERVWSILSVPENLPVLARLIGFVSGDGNLKISWDEDDQKEVFNVQVYGDVSTMNEVEKDLQQLGFSLGSLETSTPVSILSSDHKIAGTSMRRRSGSTHLFLLLSILGTPVGDKAAQAFEIPPWIRQHPYLLWNYLRGFFGAELAGIQPYMNKRCFGGLSLAVRKTEQFIPSGIRFIEQLKEGLALFNVSSKYYVGHELARKDGTHTRAITLNIHKSRDNLVSFSHIGFAYELQRQGELEQALDFCHRAVPWNRWKPEHAGWDPLVSIAEEGEETVYDITVDQTHNYIADCFLVHNCIYGTRQFGVEDQGWIAWFVIASLLGKPLTIYGDGKQVRDVLWISDLLTAYDLFAESRIKQAVFNIGGGAANVLSLLDLLDLIKKETGLSPAVSYADWRQSDQKVYVSDNRRIEGTLGWKPTVSPQAGVKMLVDWVAANKRLFGGPQKRI